MQKEKDFFFSFLRPFGSKRLAFARRAVERKYLRDNVSEELTLRNTQINLVFHSLNRTFAPMKRRITLFLLLITLSVSAQKEQTWEQVWQEMMMPEDNEEESGISLEAYYDQLQQLSEHPIDLNHTTREELEQLPFLSDQQIMDLIEYLDRYGPMRSMNELKMIRSFDYQQLALMPFFVYVGEVAKEAPRFPSLQNIAKYGKHTVTATGHIPFYERKGDQNGYLGYRYRHSLRYEFSYGNYVKAGIIGAQDAGEPFFANQNNWGYDTYSYYIQLKKLGIIENVILGKYKVSAGMGLVLNTSFQLGKLATLQNMGRQTNTLRAHSSRSEADYFQGAAATIRLSKPLTLTTFASYRGIDATLNDDGTAATLITSGYHRTVKEMEKKHNTHLSAFGGSISYRQHGLHLGANAVYTSIDRTLRPKTETKYRRYYPQGNNFLNASIDYGYTHYRFVVSGETALNKNGALATINSLSIHPSGDLSLIAIQRFYSYRYNGLYAHGFGNSTRTQNESGLYLGLSWTPLARLHLQGYADYAYSPWSRYQISQASHTWDMLLQGTLQWHQWSLQARHRTRLQQKDDDTKKRLIPYNEHRTRLSITHTSNTGWTSKTQADYVYTVYKERSQGWMISQQTSYQQNAWQASLALGYFDTDSYQARIYLYERQLQHEFTFPSYYGNGLRLALYAQLSLNDHLRLATQLGYTNYFDRSSIGNELQEIAQSHTTDLNLQLRWRI